LPDGKLPPLKGGLEAAVALAAALPFGDPYLTHLVPDLTLS
jgi:hypothetical protein